MVRFGPVGFVVLALLLAGCVSSEWVHPNKPKDEFAQDWNKCESDTMKDPKLQLGSKYLLQQATERCVLKKGWVLKQVD
jgi:Tfp pilus assembly protein PilF